MIWKYFLFILTITIMEIIVIIGIRHLIADIIKRMAQVSTGIIQYYNGEKEKGRDNIANGLAQDFGLDKDARALLRDTCELPNGSCNKCKWWTCPGKEKNE